MKHDPVPRLRALGLTLALLVAGGCKADRPPGLAAADQAMEAPMWITINGRRFAITLADNNTARAFAAQLPLALEMEDLNGNEKHARLPTPLRANASRPGVIKTGDLMLYGADTLVIFYAGFNSNYSYTRIGKVDDTAGLAQALGPQGARVSFSGR